MYRKYNLVFFMFLVVNVGIAQENREQVKANYQLAARFSPDKLRRLIFSTSVSPNWLKNSNRFWYVYETSQGKNWYIVDPSARKKDVLFDNAQLAAQLTRIVKDPFDAQHIDIRNLKFTEDERRIRFEVNSTKDTLKTKEEREKSTNKTDSLKKKVFYLEYDLQTRQLVELADSLKPKPHLSWASFSPDTNAVVFAKNYNLYWMDRENYEKARKDEKDSTIVEHQITTDGIQYYAWGGDDRSVTTGDEKKDEDEKNQRRRAGIIWSPDGRYFLVTRKDNRHLNSLWVINNVGSKRPTLETYKYQMPGEPDSTEQELHLFEFATKKPRRIDVAAFKNQTLAVYTKRQPRNNRPDDIRVNTWLGTNEQFFFSRSSRDLKRIDIGTAAIDGSVKILIEERSNTYLDVQPPELVGNGPEFVVWSERDGWGHYYLYDGNGNLKNQITSGEFYCSEITGLDEKTRTLYFVANGREANEDPYYQHLYSINLNGSGMKLLNAGNFDHQALMDENSQFFVNNYSRVNTTPESALYNNAGQQILKLETADLSQLFAAGYKFPEPFKVKADDGITDLYGVMYKPFHFDSTQTYPLIEYVYPGPQTESVNKAFGRSMDRIDRLAQFGFVVITVGNRGGHPARSKWYHTYGYGNLRDYGLADKKAAAEQLADRHPFIDINRVGITGHSGGGFMSTAAMLVYPDFFKVAVSGAGNHENNIYNRWWSERHHGVTERISAKGDTTFSYAIEKNTELAKNLKGRLLLATGDIDNNVHPANTIRMAEALIKANKRFDFLLLPGQRHGFGDMTEYFFWKMGDYFCKHLLGNHQDDVDITEMNREIPRRR
ncbi:Dipeptidyl aminopeptidase/acylaminoacyl peptidase [Parapedobacter luteus]|uniref:Dipeptidyl aminopeptidase/acylaminoacyl peptidase n=1 Tax=Parapedobacter luteus TaxID=623280 RepID=A0A1T5AX14_9SPHI|nr:DPP IV N-terminal domain-containing protein [Parapedobacter luteus]SKB39516.1 Dipeptidyl aminopeptidase/acylaminoacyl peptidase [Parapedobacter luteus]